MVDDRPKKRPLNIEKLRDHFAGIALPVVIVRCVNDSREPGETIEQLFARRSYEIADAMLAEREK